MTTGYIESSALVAWVLAEGQASDVARCLRRLDAGVTSALTLAETRRAVARASRELRLPPARASTAVRRARKLVDGWDLVPIDEAILERASRPFRVEPIRTLDAIHLASIERAARAFDDLVVISLDARVRANAAARDLPVLP